MPKNIKELSDAEKFCLAGYVLTGDAEMAYRLSRKNFVQKPDAPTHHKMSLMWLREKGCRDYLAYLNNVPEIRENDDEPGKKTYRQKEDIVAEMEQLIPNLTGTDKLNALVKLADIQQMKKEEVRGEDERIHYYLPLPYCTNCPNRHNIVKDRENWIEKTISDQKKEEIG